MIGDRLLTFVVRGILKNEGPARVLTQFHADWTLPRRSWRSIALAASITSTCCFPKAPDLYQSLAAIAARLPAGVSAQRPARRGEQVETCSRRSHQPHGPVLDCAIVGLSWSTTPSPSRWSRFARKSARCARLGFEPQQGLLLFLARPPSWRWRSSRIGLGLARLLADGAVTMTCGR